MTNCSHCHNQGWNLVNNRFKRCRRCCQFKTHEEMIEQIGRWAKFGKEQADRNSLRLRIALDAPRYNPFEGYIKEETEQMDPVRKLDHE